ncbi:MAG: T9SS type A sorting domain-containing protein [Crocinitomicaceae bacterium]
MKFKNITHSLLFSLLATSAAYSQYCSPNIAAAPLATWGIIGVQYGTLVKASAVDTYSDFTSDVATIALGSTNTLVISISGSPQMGKVVWIDWDQSETFETTEMYIFDDFSNSFDIVTPSTAILGSTRMRLAVNQFGATNIDPCLSPLYEVEDYTVNITGGGSNVGLAEEDHAIIPFKLYPNPTENTVNILWDETSLESGVIIYNNVGQVVITVSKEELNQPIDVSVLSSGVYFVKANAIDNAVPMKLIVK